MGACDVILVTWAKCLILIGSQPFLLHSDWSGPSGALFTTLSNPSKTSPKCIHNSTVHNEALTCVL